MKKSKEKEIKPVMDISSSPTGGLPGTAIDMVNNYGTYEIQPTAQTDNQYPCIAQGYNPKKVKRDGENRHSKNDRWDK